MSEKTDYKRTLAGSVGAGMKSIFGAGGRTYYILEHKVSSQYHKAGESQEIIVDQIELGRDAKCQVRYDENFKTVSRRHAAIVREGSNWKLVQLSKTNTTFLNGRPITTEWYLQSGDEIQLSVNGPKLGFIIPTGNKSTVGSIGLTRRLSLFRQQALRPYKAAIWVMSALILLLIGGFVASEIYHYQKEQQWIQEHADLVQKLKDGNITMQGLSEQLDSLQKVKQKVTYIGDNDQKIAKELKELSNDVYFMLVYLKVTLEDGTTKDYSYCTGTGFLLDDGRFVTARHCVEPWTFPTTETDEWINIKRNSGYNLTTSIVAYSPNDGIFYFETEDFTINDDNDQIVHLSDDNIMKVADLDCNDYAYTQTKKKGKLKMDAELSEKLTMRTTLHVLGYPLGLGADNAGVSPYYSTAIVARDGLAEGGYIPTTSSSFEHGNSGGPVFAKTKKGFRVVGIISAGAGRSTGFIVPVSKIK